MIPIPLVSGVTIADLLGESSQSKPWKPMTYTLKPTTNSLWPLTYNQLRHRISVWLSLTAFWQLYSWISIHLFSLWILRFLCDLCWGIVFVIAITNSWGGKNCLHNSQLLWGKQLQQRSSLSPWPFWVEVRNQRLFGPACILIQTKHLVLSWYHLWSLTPKQTTFLVTWP